MAAPLGDVFCACWEGLSIATRTISVEVLVGWSPAVPRRFSQKRPGVRANFLHVKKKKVMRTSRMLKLAVLWL